MKTNENTKLSDKARELGVKSTDLIAKLKEAGYDFKNPNAILSKEALQFLEFEEDLIIKTELKDSIEQAIVVPTNSGKFEVIKFLVNTNFQTQEISRVVFDSRIRAYYELNYLVSRYEQGR
jgi:hypothetical protein